MGPPNGSCRADLGRRMGRRETLDGRDRKRFVEANAREQDDLLDYFLSTARIHRRPEVQGAETGGRCGRTGQVKKDFRSQLAPEAPAPGRHSHAAATLIHERGEFRQPAPGSSQKKPGLVARRFQKG